MQKNRPNFTDGYDPGRLFNALRAHLKLRSDAALARVMEMPALLIRLMRKKDLLVTPEFLIRAEEVSGWSGRALRDLMGDRRRKFRFEQVRDPEFGEIIAEIYEAAAAKKSC
jgi:hypothetical protein